MRTLFVSDETGWPENTGYRMRIAHIARAIASLGPFDWIVLAPDPAITPAAPPECPTMPWVIQLHERSRASARLHWVCSHQPRRVAAVDIPRTRQAINAVVPKETLDQYDLIFYTHLDTELIAGGTLRQRGPVVAVDIDNVDSSMISFELAALGGRMGPLRRFARRIDRERWRQAELKALEAHAVTFVCSELDKGRMDGRSVVIPNGAVTPMPTYRRAPNPDRPVLLFVGAMSYEPNIDAVEYFAHHVFPIIRRGHPDAEFRIVGRNPVKRVRGLGSLENVTVVGAVESVEPELASAHVAVAPLRFGGGTRLKILEALAHEVPVVTTTVGCEGLDIQSGTHALIADGPLPMANACLSLLEDPSLARSLSRSGLTLVRTHYDWAEICRDLAATLRHVADHRSTAVASNPPEWPTVK